MHDHNLKFYDNAQWERQREAAEMPILLGQPPHRPDFVKSPKNREGPVVTQIKNTRRLVPSFKQDNIRRLNEMFKLSELAVTAQWFKKMGHEATFEELARLRTDFAEMSDLLEREETDETEKIRN